MVEEEQWRKEGSKYIRGEREKKMKLEKGKVKKIFAITSQENLSATPIAEKVVRSTCA